MINRILERLEEPKNYSLMRSDDDDYYDGKATAYEHAIEIVQEVAKEYGKDTNVRSNVWIPCSERLPELKQEVLITANDNAVYQGVMANGGFMVFKDGWIDTKHVLAWQPLPAPYQKGE